MNDTELTTWARFVLWLDDHEWIAAAMLLLGIVTSVLFSTWIGEIIIGSAVVVAGLVPLASGYFVGPILGELEGASARWRGLASVAIGVFFIGLGISMKP